MPVFEQRVLILCKTYPSPSGKHVETSCVAGVLADGSLIRLYPVPFRLINGDKQFKKWQWITAKIEKAKSDHRLESHQIKVDTLTCDTAPLPTKDDWQLRRDALAKTPVLGAFSEVDLAQKERGQSLALLKPDRLVALDIEPVTSPEWTEDEKAKLLQQQQQGNLFEEEEKVDLRTLKKLPYSFHYRYECVAPDGTREEWRHKISDWEAGALYWNCKRKDPANWQDKFRAQMFDNMQSREMIFLMGNIHRFQNQWLIVSMLYFPKQTGPAQQTLL